MVRSGTPFRLQIRRSTGTELPFALRFRVDEGRGMFILPRSGVTSAPPATQEDTVADLSADEVRGARFLHIPANTRLRRNYALDRISSADLSTMPEERWLELDAVLASDGAVVRMAPNHPEIELQPAVPRSIAWKPDPSAASAGRSPPAVDARPTAHSRGKARQKQTAAERIAQLEDELGTSQLRIAALTRRVAELEREIEATGGDAGPWEMDTRKGPDAG